MSVTGHLGWNLKAGGYEAYSYTKREEEAASVLFSTTNASLIFLIFFVIFKTCTLI